MKRLALASATLILAVAMATVTASAAYPGHNGQIAFDDGSVSPMRIGVVNPDGTGEQTLSQRGDHSPRYSRDGSTIVFFSTRDQSGANNADAEIFTMSADGSNQTQLTFNDLEDQVPAWTADGRIVFTRRNATGQWNIWIMDANGDHQRQLTYLGGVSAWPAPAPNGHQVAFSSNYRGQFHIYTMRLDGTKLRQISPDDTVDWAPEWSPRGNDIVFTREALAPNTSAGVDEDVFIVHSDGTRLRQLTRNPARADLFPSWSPDRRFVIFYRATDWQGPNWHSNLITYELPTANESTVGRPDIGGYPGWQPVSSEGS